MAGYRSAPCPCCSPRTAPLPLRSQTLPCAAWCSGPLPLSSMRLLAHVQLMIPCNSSVDFFSFQNGCWWSWFPGCVCAVYIYSWKYLYCFFFSSPSLQFMSTSLNSDPVLLLICLCQAHVTCRCNNSDLCSIVRVANENPEQKPIQDRLPRRSSPYSLPL